MTVSRAPLKWPKGMSAAAKETGIEVPETIRLPQGMTTSSSAKTGPVAVFSGPARQQIPDAGFASGDTDITFGKKNRTGLTRITGQVKDLFTPPARYDRLVPKHVTAAALYSVGGIVFVNMALFWLSGIFGWKVFGHAWPLEIDCCWRVAFRPDGSPGHSLAADPGRDLDGQRSPVFLLRPDRLVDPLDLPVAVGAAAGRVSRSLRPSCWSARENVEIGWPAGSASP